MKLGDPLWTKPVEESNRALDPLAMNRVTLGLLGELIPGITTITPRARYYSLHLWSTQDIAERESVDTEAQFFSEMYRRERLFMLASVSHAESSGGLDRDHTNIVGTNQGHKVWESGDDPIPLDFRFLGRRSGGYGAAYTGPLQTMGLIETPPEGSHEQPTEAGEPIAEAFDEVAESSGLKRWCQADEIPRDKLDALADQICICRVADDDAPDREPLRDLFLGRSPIPGLRRHAEARRSTLLLILSLARWAEQHGTPFSRSALLDACYFGALEASSDFISVEVPEALAPTAARWQVFRAHDYLAFASEALLETWLEYLDAHETEGATREGFLERATSPAVIAEVEKSWETLDLEEGRAPLRDLVSAIWPDVDASAFQSGQPIKPTSIEHPFSEYNLDRQLDTALEEGDFETVLARWPQLLVAMALRFSRPDGHRATAWEWMASHTGSDLSPARFRKELRAHLTEGSTLNEFIAWFVNEYLIDHAVQIYREKATATGRPRRWFHRQGGYWVKDRDWQAGRRTTRFTSSVSILRDLGLLDPDPEEDRVTSDGRATLDEFTDGGR